MCLIMFLESRISSICVDAVFLTVSSMVVWIGLISKKNKKTMILSRKADQDLTLFEADFL